MKTNEIKLGNKVRDRVTGFTGIAISRVEYLNGCVQFCIKPPVDSKTGKNNDGEYVDSQQVEFVSNGLVVKADKTGGPSADCPREKYRA